MKSEGCGYGVGANINHHVNNLDGDAGKSNGTYNFNQANDKIDQALQAGHMRNLNSAPSSPRSAEFER